MKLAELMYSLDQEANLYAHWSAQDFQNELDSAHCQSILRFNNDNILMGFLLFRQQFDESWLMNIVVREKKQGMGIALINEWIELMLKNGKVSSLWLEVREDNLPAQCLYKKLGFHTVNLRKGYYNQGRHNAVVMKKIINKS
jgi:ribosomal-protein-alanine N-acetyltransferase